MAKWVRKNTFSDDTFVNLEMVEGKSFQDMSKFLEHIKTGVYYTTNSAVAKLAKEARKKGSDVEGLLFTFGTHWVRRKNQWVETKSYYDPDLGGFRTSRRRSKDGDGYRLSNFKYLKTAKRYQDGDVRSVAELSSQIANLYENRRKWTKNSPFFKFGDGTARRWRAGMDDGQKGYHHFFKYYVNGVASSTAKAVAEIERDFDIYIKEGDK